MFNFKSKMLMKKCSLIIFALLMSATSFSQTLSLEREYSNSRVVYLERGNDKNWVSYEYHDPGVSVLSVSKVSFYNMDHTFISQLEVPFRGHYPQRIEAVSRNFIVAHYATFMLILNGEGSVIDSIGSATDGMLVGGGTKFIAYGRTTTRVYSLEESIPDVPVQSISTEPVPYPNPSSENVTLAYTLDQGDTGMLIIASSFGNVVKTYPIGSAFNNIKVNVEDLTPGIYTYSVASNGDLKKGKTFIVE